MRRTVSDSRDGLTLVAKGILETRLKDYFSCLMWDVWSSLATLYRSSGVNRWSLIIGRGPSSQGWKDMTHVYGVAGEAYKGNGGGVKENSGFRAGWVGAKLLEHLALTGAREFNLSVTAREIGVDVRRLYQTVAYFIKRHIMAKVRRGRYRILVDPWELLQRIIVQGPNAQRVKENHGTRSVAVRAVAGYVDGVVGLFFDNVRGDLVRFSRVSYAEVSVATGTGLFEGLGVFVVYYACKWYGLEFVCSDWVEWRPPSGFYRQRSVVEAVNVFRSRVLPYVFGLAGRSGVVVGAGLERFRAALYGLARQLYLALRVSVAAGL
jgi:hypothetical protein